MTDDGELVIDTTSKMFKVEIKITDDENNVIPMEKSTISIFNFLRSINVSWDLSFKNKWALIGFIAELFGVFLAIWLFREGDFIEGYLVLLFSIIGLVKFTPKRLRS